MDFVQLRFNLFRLKPNYIVEFPNIPTLIKCLNIYNYMITYHKYTTKVRRSIVPAMISMTEV